MTQEEKQILLNDLKCRLYTKTQCKCIWADAAKNGSEGAVIELDTYILDELENIDDLNCERVFCDIKPYLRSIDGLDIQCGRWDKLGKVTSNLSYLIEGHYDVNGLIPMGLALEAPEGMYNSK